MMKVTLYTTEDNAECKRVWDMLAMLAARDDFELVEAPSPDGAPSPCVRFDAPGSPFYRADGLSEEQFVTYLRDAEKLALETEKQVIGQSKKRPARKAGSAPDAQFEQAHPVRSFMWRHRVGTMISGLSAFVGLAWAAPLLASTGWGNGVYDAIHRVYRLVCDQVPERSAQIGGAPVCLCWRCTAIYTGALIFGILYTVARDRNINWLGWLTRPVSLIVMLLYGLPLILDGATHALGLRTDIAYAHSPDFWLSWEAFSADWWLRIATALVATVGAVKFLCPRLDKLGSVYEHLYNARKGKEPGRATTATVATITPLGAPVPKASK